MSEIQDNVKSTQIAELVDIVSEGDCVGLVNGAKDVFLEGTPLQNADGSYNFEGVHLDWRTGTVDQSPLPGINAVQSEVTVNVDVLQATPVVRTITSTSVDKCRVTIMAPRLFFQDTSSGDISGSSFQFAIDVQASGGAYVEVLNRTIEGKTNSQYSKSFEFSLTGSAPWNIRVRRISADPAGSNVANAFKWSSFTEIQSVKLRYPYTGYTFLRVDAQAFNQIPARTFKWRGKKIKVPTNYNTTTRIYTGVWDGTFKTEWTDNPAWVFYDMVTTARYGLGNYVDPAEVNKWRLYKIAQYCDGLVPNGSGGTEPRFTINAQIRDRKEAYRLLQDLSSVFRGMPFWDGAKVDVYQDSPEPVSLIYAPANVVGGNFEYEGGSSEKSRHSVFICYWNDMTDQGRRTAEVYAPNDLITRYGMREIELSPMGVTSRSMAARLCRWARHTEEAEGETVGFSVGSDGIVAQPGKVFSIADPSVAGERLGGRIVAATTTQVTLDAPVTLDSGVTYTLTVIQPDSIDHMEYDTEDRTVTTAAGADLSVLTVSPAFSATPTQGTLWILSSANVEPTLWRCTDVEEQDKGGYKISGTAYNASKYDAIELGLTLDQPVITKLSTVASPPTGLTLEEEIYSDGTVNKSALTVAFIPASGSSRYQIKYRRDTGWWVDLPESGEQSATIRGLEPGVYDVVVRAINGLGNVSPAVQGTITLAGGKSGVRAVRLKASALTFKVPTSGPASPTSITITADCGALDEAGLSWSATGGTLTGTGTTRTLTYANMSADVAMVTATITVGSDVYTDTVTIIKVADGATGPAGAAGSSGVNGARTAVLEMYQWAASAPTTFPSGSSTYTWATGQFTAPATTNGWSLAPTAPVAGQTLWLCRTVYADSLTTETTSVTWSASASVATGAAGSNGAEGAAGSAGANGTRTAILELYQWAASTPSTFPSGTSTYTWATGDFTAPTTPAEWSLTPGAAVAGQTLWGCMVRFADSGTSSTSSVPWSTSTAYAIGAAGANGSNGAPGATGDTGATGAPGAPGVSAVMTLDSIGLPADTAGAVTSYAGAASTMLVALGGADDTSNWTFSHTETDVTVTRSVNTITITSMGSGVAIGYVDVTATRSGYPSITKRVTVSKYKTGATGPTGATGSTGATGDTGLSGPRGSVTLAASTAGTSWSDSEANAAITGAGFAGPVNRDVVTLYNTSTGWSEARFYSGSSWLTLNAWITGNLLVDGTIEAEKIKAGTITTDRIQVGAASATSSQSSTSTTIMPLGSAVSYATGTVSGPVISTIGRPIVVSISGGLQVFLSATANRIIKSLVNLKAVDVSTGITHSSVGAYADESRIMNDPSGSGFTVALSVSGMLPSVPAGTYRIDAYVSVTSRDPSTGNLVDYIIKVVAYTQMCVFELRV